jgi:hypothetical protein
VRRLHRSRGTVRSLPSLAIVPSKAVLGAVAVGAVAVGAVAFGEVASFINALRLNNGVRKILVITRYTGAGR